MINLNPTASTLFLDYNVEKWFSVVKYVDNIPH